jgi:UDP-N-acetylmuramoylalanine--D-glutamate ligase
LTDLNISRALVVGAGRTGAAVTAALTRRDVSVTVLETGTATARAAADELAGLGATIVHNAEGISVEAFDVIVPSPGVPEHAELLVAATAGAVPVWSEPELAWRIADGRTVLVAITGTNGKTTTTELTAACLDAPTGGNIGTPLVTLLDRADAPPRVVAELSSFQLRFAETLRPHVAVLLNVAPDHLDWHGSLTSYRSAKARLWQRQEAGDVTVYNADDDGARTTVAEHPPPAGTVSFTLGVPADGQVGIDGGAIVATLQGQTTAVAGLDTLALSGPHNIANACAAVAAALAAGAPAGTLAGPLQRFRPGAHRLEDVATVNGVRYVNDSKATNPHAAAAALSSFEQGRVLWIAGGLGKGLDFDSLAPLIASATKVVLTIGASGPQIAAVAAGAGVEVVDAGTLDAAVARAAALAGPGDVVLLAPACASMDQFTDYAHRGTAFRDAVARLLPQGASSGR